MEDVWVYCFKPTSKKWQEMLLLNNLPHQRVAVIQDVNASLFISIYLIATDDAFPVAKDNDAGAKAAVDPITLPFDLCTSTRGMKNRKQEREISHRKVKDSVQ